MIRRLLLQLFIRPRSARAVTVVIAATLASMSVTGGEEFSRSGSENASLIGCSSNDDDGDGWTPCDGDCNDGTATTFPGAAETCDGFDNDCDGAIDNSPDCARRCDRPGTLSGEVRMSSLHNPWSSSLVWTGNQFGLVWFGDDRGDPAEDSVRFSILDDRGVLRTERIMFGPATSTHFGSPGIVWNGSEYGIVWARFPGGGRDGQIDFARVDDSGVVLSTPITITEKPSQIWNLHILWTGERYAVSWSDRGTFTGQGSPGAYLAVFVPDAAALASPVRIGDVPTVPRIAWNGEAFGFFWTDDTSGTLETRFTLLDETGSLISGPFDIGAGGTQALAWDGEEFGLFWTQFIADVPWTKYATLSSTGTISQPPVVILERMYGPRGISVAFTGLEYGMTWWEHPGLSIPVPYFMTFDKSELTTSDIRELIPLNRGAHEFSLVWTGSQFAMSYDAIDEPMGGNESRLTYFAEINCDCPDLDADGFFDNANCGTPFDCDDGTATVYPGAEQACDGVNNDCDDPEWPTVPVIEADGDGDGFPICQGDCDDRFASVYPGAPQLCDRRHNDCLDPSWPIVPADELDADGDGFATCAGDCDDSAPTVFPDAPQLCDGVHNDCSAPEWPTVPLDERDADYDEYATCTGDCDDADNRVHPGAGEVCNDRDDDCNGLIDDDVLGEDSDEDMIRNACDNCPSTMNPPQADFDFDAVGDACDNCPFDRNMGQSDTDADAEGDACDLDDGLIYLRTDSRDVAQWDREQGYVTWNHYQGDLTTLRETGVYSQSPGSNPLATRACGLADPSVPIPDVPQPGQVAFYLTTGVDSGGGSESDLGLDGAGVVRPNHDPCP